MNPSGGNLYGVQGVMHSGCKPQIHGPSPLGFGGDDDDGIGEKVMTMDDFVRSCNDNAVIDVIKYSQLRSLYRIFRG